MRRSGALALPFVAGAVLLVVLPMLATGYYAFTDHTGLGDPHFTGLANLRRLSADPVFAAAVRASLIHAALTVPIRMLAATAFGLLLAAPRRGGALYRAAVYLPTVIPDIALALLVLWLLNPLYGPVNQVLGAVGIAGPNWFATPWGARSGVALMAVVPIGEAFLVVLAARRTVTPRLYEAASLDGASPWQRFRHVTLPAMAPLLAVLAIRDAVQSLQTSFLPAFILTDGRPGNATLSLPLYAYDQAFEFLGFGYGALLTLVIAGVTAIALVLAAIAARRWWPRTA